MNMTMSIAANPSAWSDWSLGTGDFGYTATGSGVPLSRGTGQGWIGSALVVALTSAGVVGQSAYAVLVGTGGTAEYLIDQGQSAATTPESWGGCWRRLPGNPRPSGLRSWPGRIWWLSSSPRWASM